MRPSRSSELADRRVRFVRSSRRSPWQKPISKAAVRHLPVSFGRFGLCLSLVDSSYGAVLSMDSSSAVAHQQASRATFAAGVPNNSLKLG
jgi:hypothetical protein